MNAILRHIDPKPLTTVVTSCHPRGGFASALPGIHRMWESRDRASRAIGLHKVEKGFTVSG